MIGGGAMGKFDTGTWASSIFDSATSAVAGGDGSSCLHLDIQSSSIITLVSELVFRFFAIAKPFSKSIKASAGCFRWNLEVLNILLKLD